MLNTYFSFNNWAILEKAQTGGGGGGGGTTPAPPPKKLVRFYCELAVS